MPDQSLAQSSMLCIDITSTSQSVLFRQSCNDFADMPRLVLPAPSAILSRKIVGATMQRRDIFLAGPAMGREFIPALTSHVRQSCRAAMEERTAKSIYTTLDDAQSAGIDIIDSCPDGYLLLPTGETDMAFWHMLCHMLACDEPTRTAIAATDTGPGDVSDNGACSGTMWFWKNILREHADIGAPPEAFLLAEVPEAMPRLAAIQAASKGLVTDSGVASLLGLLSDADIRERSFRQGVVLLHAGEVHVTAFLVWRGRIFGMYEHHANLADIDKITHDLSEFRLGWLPDETVRAAGGHGTAFALLPPEAEGFPVTYVTGKGQRMFTGYGKLINNTEMAFNGCLGLAYAADLW